MIIRRCLLQCQLNELLQVKLHGPYCRDCRTISSLLDSSIEFGLFLTSLEAAMAELRRGVDELQCDLLLRPAAGLCQQRFPEGYDAILASGTCAFDEQEVFVDLTIVWETTHWCDGLLSDVILSLSIVRVVTDRLANLVDLLVNLST